ncbi:MAG TPA: hypothetical protein VJM08_16525, partial [Anaerolineales bacterium]|nr:hypothetical protein [Anaerolineales bacterium]
MNKDNMPVPPDENKIEELLAKIQPRPSERFHQKMKRATWQTGNFGYQIKNVTSQRVKVILAMILLFLLAVLLITPQAQIWAQETVGFFQRINSTTIQLSGEQIKWMNEEDREYDLPLIPVFIPPVSSEMAAISGCETPQKSQSYRCQVALAESKLGFDLKELPETIKDWELRSLDVNTDSRVAVMRFDLDFKDLGFASHSSLWLLQGVDASPDFNWDKNNPWGVVPAEKVEPVSIGTHKGEYVKGGFFLKPGDNALEWSEEGREQRLAWSEGARWYLIEFWPNLNMAGTMGKDQLVQLAESLVSSSIQTTEPLKPSRLQSIADAEKVSGLDLKAPTLLPIDMDFYYARFLPDERQVHLIYGLNEELVIHVWRGDPVEYKKPLGKYEFSCEIANMSGDEAFYCFFEGSNPRSFLWWRRDGLNYQMYYESFSTGQLDREKMLLIAESMQDIDDFTKNNARSYEQVVLYEQALGMDAKKFLETPSGWTFDYFWSNAHLQCVGLVYASPSGQATLSINQCKTDRVSDISIFPLRSMERVKVGNARGLYITGGFVVTDDGTQIWDSTSPRKQLYWQEDGL